MTPFIRTGKALLFTRSHKDYEDRFMYFAYEENGTWKMIKVRQRIVEDVDRKHEFWDSAEKKPISTFTRQPNDETALQTLQEGSGSQATLRIKDEIFLPTGNPINDARALNAQRDVYPVLRGMPGANYLSLGEIYSEACSFDEE
jgi:hypothetical protein